MNTVLKKRLVIITGLIFAWWFFFFDFRVYQLNNILEQDPQISSYPYEFSVVSFDDGIAKISSPRSGKVSAVTVLRAMFPELRNKSDDSPQMIQAQQNLAKVQSQVATIIKLEEDVKRVSWELDEYWLQNKGIQVF
jgi:hypothetical protein